MFIHEVRTLGSLQSHAVFNWDTGCGFEVVPQAGANLLRLALCGEELVDGYVSERELKINRSCKSNVLFPFPNRLKRGKYLWQGEEYFFQVNDSFTGNALHGFRKELNFYLAEVSTEKDRASLTCIYEEHGNDMVYPFPFSCRIDFVLQSSNQFEWKASIWNEDRRAIPFGLGWHPYFRLADTINTVRLHLPVCDFVGIDEYMLPTGKRYPFDEFSLPKALGSTVLDNCFALPDTSPPVFTYSLEGALGKLTFEQETGPGRFNYLQLFTPPHRNSIAVEPMTCNIDAFNNGEGLIVLNPKEKMQTGIRLNFDPFVDL